MRFRGRSAHNLDNKGRLSIPARFREVLKHRYGNATLIMTNTPECLHVYPWSEWQALEEKLSNSPFDPPELRLFKRYFLGSAEECQPDRQGRILIPAHLREEVGIEREVVLLGMLNYFEIWSPERLEKEFKRVRENFGELSASVANILNPGVQA
ncbi:division/cell wall cluster transcriptional repressor MraZ [Thermodesulfatator atlanticus]|uniref:division/cell wall cluster transcriptional repressor MraZ n=1 Tax=Thermodesulfatator atlanticus TaxID=501497 RepID=UPI0003B39A41|nr:division/cell wall cluster transcriptional repressor MraZ [Thermodesulfatator atlanticus]